MYVLLMIFLICMDFRKQNIAYQIGRRATSEDSHDDLRGSQERNIEYQQGPRAKVDVFHVILGVRMLRVLMDIVGAPILPLDSSGRQIGHFRDLKLAMILKASFQNWLVSRMLVAGSMCQIIPVRLVRLLYFQVLISEGVSNIGLFQNQSWYKSTLVCFKI